MNKTDPNWKPLYKIGLASAIIFVLYSLVTMVAAFTVGGRPESAAEAFRLLAENRLVGLLRLDALTLLTVPLYYPLYLGLYIPLKKIQPAYAALAALLAFAGLTLFLATPSAFSLIPLSDKYAAAANAAQQEQLLAAGEALLAADMWNNTGARIGGLLMLVAALILSLMMLKSESFSKATAWVGILTHGFDLAHALVGLFLPQAGLILMMVAGPLYLVWFPLLGRDFFRLGRS